MPTYKYMVTVTSPTPIKNPDEIRGNLWHLLNKVNPELVVQFTDLDVNEIGIDVETEDVKNG